MSEMIERVARAIYDAATTFDGDPIGVHLSNSMMIDGSAVDAADLKRIVVSVCEDAAKAAIEAMREPSPEMQQAGEHIYNYGPLATYAAMIDEALK